MSNLSFVEHIGNGTNRQFTIAVAGENLGYFRTTDIKAYVDGVEVAFTINPASPHIAVLDTAPADKAVVLLRRVMPVKTAYADFSRGNNFGHRQVNNTVLQQLYLTQELIDGFTPLGFYMKQNVDMGGHRHTNVGDGIDESDSINKGQLTEQDVRHKAWNEGQDTRLTALESSLPINGNLYKAHFYYVAKGGELSLETNYNLGSADVSINGIVQPLNFAFNVLGSQLILAEPLEAGDIVYAILGAVYDAIDVTGTGTWYYSAVGGEQQVNTSLTFKSLILTINGVVQIQAKAYNTAGSVIHLAEPLSADDELYAVVMN